MEHKSHHSGISEHAHIYPNAIIGNNVTIYPGAVIGRLPQSSGASHSPSIEGYISLYIGDNCVIGANAVIYAGSTVSNNTMICDTACVRENVMIGAYSLIAMGVTINSNTRIGSRTKIMDNTHITGNAIIGDNVFIGMLVTTANDNDMDKGDTPISEMLGPRIADGVKIGQGACIMPGIEIGENSIIGAGSIVTKNIPANSLAVGSPARVIKKVTV